MAGWPGVGAWHGAARPPHHPRQLLHVLLAVGLLEPEVLDLLDHLLGALLGPHYLGVQPPLGRLLQLQLALQLSDLQLQPLVLEEKVKKEQTFMRCQKLLFT